MPLKRRNKLPFMALSVIALLAGFLAAVPIAEAAGTTPLALVPQVDNNGNVAAGCQLTFFQAGTTATKQNAYADFALTQALPNPVPCDQAGRVPMHWLADGLIHVRLTDSAGGVLVDTTMQVLGPSGGGGGGGGTTVDPTALVATGDLKVKYGTGPLSGFVRANGLTIGNGTSGASERANADTQSLWTYLCTTDPNLTVSGGRSGNCLNDFNASKTITLPDWRGRALAALDDMGNSAAGRLTAGYFGTSATVLGAAGGGQSQTLVTGNLPPYAPSGSISGTATSTSNTIVNPNTIISIQGSGGGSVLGIGWNSGGTITTIGSSISGTLTGAQQGGLSTPLSIVQPTMLATIYIKL